MTGILSLHQDKKVGDTTILDTVSLRGMLRITLSTMVFMVW